MLPDVSFMLKQWFGIDLPLPFKTFGLFLALAIFSAAYALFLELMRKEKAGELPKVKMSKVVGEAPNAIDIAVYVLFSFIIGFKGLYAILNYATCSADPQAFIMSSNGNWIAGIVVGILAGAYRYYDKKNKQLEKPIKVYEMVSPAQLTGDLAIIAAISGVLGSKVFDAIENIPLLLKDPIGTLLSFSGLAFYGGLIFGTIAIVIYLIYKKLPILPFADAIAPTLILGYAVGRIGCELSGDGDWGIYNMKPKPFSWIPDWAWAYDYPHNVVGNSDQMNIPIPGYNGPYNWHLMHTVFPTPLYEIIMGLAIFGILWTLRKRIKTPGVLFCIYLLLNGIERYFIELIRVNQKYTVLGFQLSQAQEIAIAIIILGMIGWPLMNRLQKVQNNNPYLYMQPVIEADNSHANEQIKDQYDTPSAN